MKNTFKKVAHRLAVSATALTLTAAPIFGMAPQVFAGSVTSASVSISNDDTSATNTTWTVNFTTATTGTIKKVQLTFETGIDPTGATVTSTALGAGSTSVTGQVVTFTVTSAGSISSGTPIDLAVTSVDNSATPANYYVSIVTKDASNQPIDDGATLGYLDDASTSDTLTENQVLVTADVPANLTLGIYSDSGLTTNTNLCALQTLLTSAVNTCTYYLKVGTNDADGYTLKFVNDGFALNNAGNTANIDDTAANTDVVAGTEGHGVEFASAGGGTTLQGNYASTSDDPVPSSATDLAASTVPVTAGTGSMVTVTHRASISTSTPADSYDQVVTYTMFTN